MALKDQRVSLLKRAGDLGAKNEIIEAANLIIKEGPKLGRSEAWKTQVATFEINWKKYSGTEDEMWALFQGLVDLGHVL